MCNKSLIGKLHSSQNSCVWLLASYSLFSILMLLRGAYTVTRSRGVVGLLISLKASPILVSQPGCYQHYMEFCCCRSEMNRDMFQVASRRAPSAAPAGVQTTEKRRLARHDAHGSRVRHDARLAVRTRYRHEQAGGRSCCQDTACRLRVRVFGGLTPYEDRV